MIKLYLITGFLGSGKTTFLKNLIPALGAEKLALIINEFGKEGVDGKLVSEIQAVVHEISNGSIFCTCRLDKFEQTLSDIIKEAPDYIIVEASGLSDPTNIRKILSGQDYKDNISFMGSICLIDAVNFIKVYPYVRACKKQIAASDIVLLNKTDLVNENQIKDIKSTILAQRPDIIIYSTTFGKINAEWLKKMRKNQAQTAETEPNIQDLTLKKHLITINNGFSKENFIKFIELIIEDAYRIKGFVNLDGTLYYTDCVLNMAKVEPYEKQVEKESQNKIVVLSGPGMQPLKSIKYAAKLYADYIKNIE